MGCITPPDPLEVYAVPDIVIPEILPFEYMSPLNVVFD